MVVGNGTWVPGPTAGAVRWPCHAVAVSTAPPLTDIPERAKPGTAALVDRSREVGVCSTRPSPSSWTAEAGVDTLRLLFETHDFGERRFELGGDVIETVDEETGELGREVLGGWQAGSLPDLGLTWVEGHPAPGRLATAAEVGEAAEVVRGLLDERLGVRTARGVSRSDQTVTSGFHRPQEARAFLAGMAAVQLPRCETTRRGHPVHSVSWTAANGARKLGRCYDKGLERGGEPWELARLEDQRRFQSGSRPPVEVVADGAYLRSKFEARFGPVRKAVDGVKAATFPVIAQALADEARYGFRDVREAERLAGSLVLLSGGAGDAYKRSTFYNRRAELREAGYVVVDDLIEAVEVDLGVVVDQALEEAVWA